MKCPNCGSPRDREDRYCPYCMTKFDPYATVPNEKPEIHIHYHQEIRPEPRFVVEPIYTPMEKRSHRSRVIALLLCLFLGWFGAHKFYLGKNGMGVLYLFTCGLIAYGWLIDLLTSSSSRQTHIPHKALLLRPEYPIHTCELHS